MTETNQPSEVGRNKVVWGAREIGEVIDRTEAQTWFLLNKGVLPARKVGGKWAAHRGALLDWFKGSQADAA